MIRSTISRSVASGLASILGIASTAHAQNDASTASAGEGRLEGERQLEIVTVTARRVEENLQRVPIAVNVVSSEAIETQNFVTINDLQQNIPGLQVLGHHRGEVTVLYVRGVQGAVAYWADVPVSLSSRALYFDMDSVQVLKGPQGTLFGTSTNGGAVVYQPKRPSTTPGGHVEVEMGTNGRSAGQMVANVPLADDRVLIRAGLLGSHTDGFQHLLSTNQDLGDENYWIGRFSMIWRPTDRIENYLATNYYDFDGLPLTSYPDDLLVPSTTATVFGASTVQAYIDQQRILGPYKLTALDVTGVTSWESQLNIADTLSFRASDDLTIKNSFGYARQKLFRRFELDGTPLPITSSPNDPSDPNGPVVSWSDELQVVGSSFEDQLSFVFGGFYSDERNDPTFSWSNGLGNLNGTRAKTTASTRAVFGQGTYHLSSWLEGLSVTAGYRYTWDSRELDQQRKNSAGVIVSSFQESTSFKAPSYMVSLTYQYSPDTMFFLTNSKGYSSGGFNAGAVEPYNTYQPESLNNLEVGIKTEWNLGGLEARTNLSAYYGWYDDVQVTVTRLFETPAGPSTSIFRLNAAGARIHGVEADFVAIPTPALRISGSVGYNAGHYTSYITQNAAGEDIDLSYLPMVDMPKWKGNLSVTYDLPIDSALGDLSITANYFQQTEIERSVNQFLYGIPQTQTPGFEDVSMNVNWQNAAGVKGLDVLGYVTNLTQNDVALGGNASYASIGFLGRLPAEPRMYGLRVRYNF